MKQLFLRSLWLALVLALTSTVQAANRDWAGTASSDWGTAANWNLAVVPGAGDGATFNTPGSFGVLLDATRSLDSMTFGAGLSAPLNLGPIAGFGLQWNQVNRVTQDSGQPVVIHPSVSCATVCTLEGTGSGQVSFWGEFLGVPNLIVNGPGTPEFYIGASVTVGGLTLNTVTVNGGTLKIGNSNAVTVLGPVVINSGGTLNLCNPGTFTANFSAPSILIGGTLFGNGGLTASTAAGVTISGGTSTSFNPGCSAGTLTVNGNLIFGNNAALNYELATPGVVGGGVNDLTIVNGNLHLDGTLNVTALAGFGVGVYRLFNYTGTLTGPGLTLGALPAGYSYAIDTTTPGQVNLVVSTPVAQSMSYTNTIQPGWNLIANQLDNGSNTLEEVFPNMLDGGSLIIFSRTNCDVTNTYAYDTGSGGWIDDSFNPIDPGSVTFAPGAAAFFFNPGASTTLTFTGTPHVPVLPVGLPCGYGHSYFLSRQTNGPGTYENITGLPPVEGARLLRWNGATYQTNLYTGGQWQPANPVVNVGEGVMIYVPPTALSYSIAIQTGFNLIANQLDRGSNTLAEIMPNVPPGTVLFKFNNASQSYELAIFDNIDLMWKSGRFQPALPNITLSPGEGAYLQSPSNFTLTLSGTTRVPVLPVVLQPNQAYLLSRQTPTNGTPEQITGTTFSGGERAYTFHGGFTTYVFDEFDLMWTPNTPVAAVGEAMWILPAGGSVPPLPSVPMPPACLTFAGVEHCALGSATLNAGSGQLTVGNLGSSGQDGVNIQLGETRFFRTALGGLESAADGALIQIHASGNVSNVAHQPMVLGQMQRSNGLWNLSASYASINVASNMIYIYNGDVLVAELQQAGGAVISTAARPAGVNVGGSYRTADVGIGPNDPCPHGMSHYYYCHYNNSIGQSPCPGSFNPNDPALVACCSGNNEPIIKTCSGPWAMTVNFNEAVALTVGMVSFSGTHVVIHPGFVDSLGALNAVSIQAANLPALALQNEQIEFAFSAHQALGQSVLIASNGLLTVANLGSSGQDGVRVNLDRAPGFGAAVDMAPLWGTVGAQLQSASRGRTSAGQELALGVARISGTSTGLALNVDFSALGATALRLNFYNSARALVGSQEMTNNGTVLVAAPNGVAQYPCPPGTVPELTGSWESTGGCCPLSIWRVRWNGNCNPVDIFGNVSTALVATVYANVHEFTVEPVNVAGNPVTLSSVQLTALGLAQFAIGSETLRSPFVPYGGLVFSPVGQAVLHTESNRLHVSNLGTNGQDGVTVDARLGLNLTWTDVTSTNPWPAGTYFEWQGRRLAGGSNHLVGRLRSEQAGDEIDVRGDFTALGTTNYHLRFYHQGTLLAERTVNVAGGPFTSLWQTRAASTNQGGGGATDFHVVDGYCDGQGNFIAGYGNSGRCPADIPTGPWSMMIATYFGGFAQIAGIGIVDAVAIDPRGALGFASQVDTVQLNVAGLSNFTFTAASIGSFGLPVRALGQTMFQPALPGFNSSPTLRNLGTSGVDGVTMELGPVGAWNAHWLPAEEDYPSGAFVTTTLRGTVDGNTNALIGTTRAIKGSNSVDLVTEFPALGAATLRYDFLRSGLLVGTTNGQPSAQPYRMISNDRGFTTDAHYTLIGPTPITQSSGTPCSPPGYPCLFAGYTFNFANPAILILAGSEISVDEVRVYPENTLAQSVGGNLQVTIQAAQVPSLTITNLQVQQIPFVLAPALVTSNGVLTLRWRSGVLQSATSLAPPILWTDVPGNPGGTYTLPLTGSGRYFRLRR